MKRRFHLENKDADRLSGSFPNLVQPTTLQDVVEGGPGSLQQGSIPNLISPDSPKLSGPRIPIMSPTGSEHPRDFETQESVTSNDGSVVSVRFASDTDSTNHIQEEGGSNHQLYTREQIAGANLLLQHLNALLVSLRNLQMFWRKGIVCILLNVYCVS